MNLLSTISEKLIRGDARNLSQIPDLNDVRARSIVTSPPYLNTQDYGASGQIGFGQNRNDYLNDVSRVFQQCWNLSSSDATLWLIVGAVRRSGRLIQLPEILTNLATNVGWIPREQITWAKGKSLPWARPGEFRDVTEQAILLSKSDSFIFNLDDVLSPDPTSPWWRRYPERYSPKGRRPTNLWDIQIPTQGSWKDGPGHLCPFPHELTYRMISVTTEPGDVVLDPFAGIGSVPAMAGTMGRIGFGVEIAEKYVDRFPTTVKQSREWFVWKDREIRNAQRRRNVFYNTIVELRLLKYANLLGKGLVAHGYPVKWIHVTKSALKSEVKHKIIVGEFEVMVATSKQRDEIMQLLCDLCDTRPLSKFGVQPILHVTNSEKLENQKYWYEQGKYWSAPIETRPKSPGFHVSSEFMPQLDEISEIKKATETNWNLGMELELELF